MPSGPTNLAVGATAGQVLTYSGRLITAYYFSTSGGRTADVRDVWPRARQVPYLVSVADPYDYYSPRHAWPTTALTPAALGAKLGVRGVLDAVAVPNRSGRAAALRVRTATGSRTIPAQAVREKLGLGSTDFRLKAMSLEEPAGRALYGEQVAVTGWVRGLGRARLQVFDGAAWRVLAHVRPRSDGRFSVPVRASSSTRLRLAYNGLAGGEVGLQVAPRLAVDADGTRLQVRVAPALPVRIERLTARQWRPVARITGSFARDLLPGSYRVAVTGGTRYLSSVSRPVGLRRPDGD